MSGFSLKTGDSQSLSMKSFSKAKKNINNNQSIPVGQSFSSSQYLPLDQPIFTHEKNTNNNDSLSLKTGDNNSISLKSFNKEKPKNDTITLYMTQKMLDLEKNNKFLPDGVSSYKNGKYRVVTLENISKDDFEIFLNKYGYSLDQENRFDT